MKNPLVRASMSYNQMMESVADMAEKSVDLTRELTELEKKLRAIK